MRSPLALIMRTLVLGYRYTLSPWLGHSCRFRPTCSEYALEAIDRHGALRGGWLTLRRLGRCHPWGGHGYDPVPADSAPADSAPANPAPANPIATAADHRQGIAVRHTRHHLP